MRIVEAGCVSTNGLNVDTGQEARSDAATCENPMQLWSTRPEVGIRYWCEAYIFLNDAIERGIYVKLDSCGWCTWVIRLAYVLMTSAIEFVLTFLKKGTFFFIKERQKNRALSCNSPSLRYQHLCVWRKQMYASKHVLTIISSSTSSTTQPLTCDASEYSKR